MPCRRQGPRPLTARRQALGLVAPRDPTKGPTFIPEWEVETTPGGPRVILNGTVQQVHAKLLEINPNYDNEFAALMNSSSEHGNSTHALETRAKFYWDKINCNGPWSVCERTKIMDGIEYLRNLFGRPRNGGGPGNCGRVSCSWNAAIWWCNDVGATRPIQAQTTADQGCRTPTIRRSMAGSTLPTAPWPLSKSAPRPMTSTWPARPSTRKTGTSLSAMTTWRARRV